MAPRWAWAGGARPDPFWFHPPRLFGPKRKMTSAIARWHSSARPPSDALELAYADRLEAEMQELAIQLHKVRLLPALQGPAPCRM